MESDGRKRNMVETKDDNNSTKKLKRVRSQLTKENSGVRRNHHKELKKGKL